MVRPSGEVSRNSRYSEPLEFVKTHEVRTVVGHSLGGNIAMQMPVDDIRTYNPYAVGVVKGTVYRTAFDPVSMLAVNTNTHRTLGSIHSYDGLASWSGHR